MSDINFGASGPTELGGTLSFSGGTNEEEEEEEEEDRTRADREDGLIDIE